MIDRRDMLKLLSAAGGMAFVGMIDQPAEFESGHLINKPQYRVIASGGTDWTNSQIEVFDHATGEKLPWGIQQLDYSIRVEGPAVMRMRYLEHGEGKSVVLTQHGFIMEHVIEGEAV